MDAATSTVVRLSCCTRFARRRPWSCPGELLAHSLVARKNRPGTSRFGAPSVPRSARYAARQTRTYSWPLVLQGRLHGLAGSHCVGAHWQPLCARPSWRFSSGQRASGLGRRRLLHSRDIRFRFSPTTTSGSTPRRGIGRRPTSRCSAATRVTSGASCASTSAGRSRPESTASSSAGRARRCSTAAWTQLVDVAGSERLQARDHLPGTRLRASARSPRRRSRRRPRSVSSRRFADDPVFRTVRQAARDLVGNLAVHPRSRSRRVTRRGATAC